jgi:hypothetical protein
MILVFGEIFRMGGLKPEIIRQGNKLYEMSVSKKGQITPTVFRDTYVITCNYIKIYHYLFVISPYFICNFIVFSYNLMPVPLDQMPSTFGLNLRVWRINHSSLTSTIAQRIWM